MIISNYLSDKIKIVSFLSIISVLYIHSGFHADEIPGMFYNNFVQELISGKIGRLAVPLFYIISGYLFFLNTSNGISTIIQKMKKRIRTLLFPYIYGCLFFVLFLLFLEFIPGVSKYMNGSIMPLFQHSILNILKTVFWISDGGNSPAAFQLWFLRDLILLVVLSPVLYYTIYYLKAWSFFLFFFLLYVPVIPHTLFRSLFWFSLGGIFVLNQINIDYKRNKWSIVSLGVYLIFSLVELVFHWKIPEEVAQLLILCGIVAVWYSFDFILKETFILENYKLLVVVCRFTFFIYLFHEPTLNIVRKLLVAGIGKSAVGYMIAYLISPFIYVCVAILVGSLLKRIMPKIYSHLVGGRI